MRSEQIVTPLDLAYFCVRGAAEEGLGLEGIRQYVKGKDSDYQNRVPQLTNPARTVGLSYPIVCGWARAEGIERDEALWFGMGIFLHDAGMPSRKLHDLFTGRYNDHNQLWHRLKFSIGWDNATWRNPFLQPATDLRPKAPWHATEMDESLWERDSRSADPWRDLWLLLNSAHQPDNAWRAYERLVSSDEVKRIALHDYLLPPIIAALCAGLVSEEQVLAFREGRFANGGKDKEWADYYQTSNEFDTVRFAAEYVSVALAFPEFAFDEIDIMLNHPGQEGDPAFALKTALARMKKDWPRSL